MAGYVERMEQLIGKEIIEEWHVISKAISSNEAYLYYLTKLKNEHDNSDKTEECNKEYKTDACFLGLSYFANRAAEEHGGARHLPAVISLGRGAVKAIIDNGITYLSDPKHGDFDKTIREFAKHAQAQYKRDYDRINMKAQEKWDAIKEVLEFSGHWTSEY